MNFRITDDGDARDIHEIYGLLKAYNLSRREASPKCSHRRLSGRRGGQEACGIDGRNLWQLALHPISFCQRTAPGPGDRRQAASGRGGRGQKTWLQIAFVDTFPFRHLHFTKSMTTGRFLPSKNIRTPDNGTITRKNCFDADLRKQL